MDLIIRKDRDLFPGDNSGVFEFSPISIEELEKSLGETVEVTIAEYKKDIDKILEMEVGDFFAEYGDPPDEDEMTIVVGSAPQTDWYSEPAMNQIKHRLYINGRPSKDIVDDIGFMKIVHDNVIDGMMSINDIPGFMEMPQWLYSLLGRFLDLRDFKIGAHPVDEPLEDGNDANYSLFWDRYSMETIYITPNTPERDRDEFGFDDIDF